MRNMAQGGFLFGVGDALAQSLTTDAEVSASDRLARCSSAAVQGAVQFGFLQSSWYRFIDKAVPTPHKFCVVALATKVGATWIVLGAIGNAVNMCYRRAVVPGARFDDALEYTRRNAGEVILNDLKVWPIFDVLLFTVFPPPLRPGSALIGAFAWNTYLSIASHKPF
ncbi:hypothetical protein M885DRAFT_567491 [Pelagophyceae sp. CCMP2097]|nr:hypothetical protein M885DRAFT_567491 [Pelagophyceae sp. CCMP2097]